MSGSYFGKLIPPSIGCIGTKDGVLNCSHSLLSNCQEDDAAIVVCQCKEITHTITIMHLGNYIVAINFYHFLAIATSSANCSDGDVRLQDGISDLTTGVMEGRLEICINEAWGSVCVDHFGSAEVNVICSSFNLTERGG